MWRTSEDAFPLCIQPEQLFGNITAEHWVGTEDSTPEGGFALPEHVFSQDILQAHLNKSPISPHCARNPSVYLTGLRSTSSQRAAVL